MPGVETGQVSSGLSGLGFNAQITQQQSKVTIGKQIPIKTLTVLQGEMEPQTLLSVKAAGNPGQVPSLPCLSLIYKTKRLRARMK